MRLLRDPLTLTAARRAGGADARPQKATARSGVWKMQRISTCLAVGKPIARARAMELLLRPCPSCWRTKESEFFVDHVWDRDRKNCRLRWHAWAGFEPAVDACSLRADPQRKHGRTCIKPGRMSLWLPGPSKPQAAEADGGAFRSGGSRLPLVLAVIASDLPGQRRRPWENRRPRDVIVPQDNVGALADGSGIPWPSRPDER